MALTRDPRCEFADSRAREKQDEIRTLSCVSSPKRSRILQRPSCLPTYVQPRKQSRPFPDDRPLLFERYPVRKSTTRNGQN